VSLLRSAHSDDDYVCTRAVGEVSRENACRMRVQRLNQLESALRLRDDRLGQLMVDPPLDPLRKESRFGVIERELKFPPDLNTFGAHLIWSNEPHASQKRQNEPDGSRRPEVSASACFG
jgi:hypothetical protein